MPVTSGAQSTEANLNDTTPAAPAASLNVKWQAGAPYADPNNPSFEVRDISANVPLDTDGTLAANSDSKIASQKATKTYVDTVAAGKVSGPVSSTDSDFAQFNGASGELLKDGGISLDTDGTLAANSDARIASQKATKTYGDTKVAGPGSSTDSDFAQFNGAGGKTLKDGGLSLDTDGTLAANSDSKIPSQKAVKTYADAHAGTGTVTHTAGALTAGQLIKGNGGADITVGDLTGDVTTAGTTAATLANIPNDVPMAGDLLATNTAAPATPASGKERIWTDSTDKRLHDKNDAGTIGTTVVKDTGATHNFLTAISAAGVISKAQPAVADLSDGSSVTKTIASGTASLGTSAIASGAAATVVTVSAPGVLTTDTIMADFNADPTGVTGYAPSANGMLTIIKYPTADNVNFKVVNNTGASITPGAITLNWRVVR